MKKITEEHIFDLLDDRLSDERRSEVLRELPNYPELEALYRTLLLTEGYVKSHAVEKTSVDFTDRVTDKVRRLVSQKKRNGILYRALSLVGLVMVASIVGVIFLAGSTPAGSTSPLTDSDVFTSVITQLQPFMDLLSDTMVRNLAMVLTAFTFFVFMDRVLMRHFSLRN